MRRKAHVGIAAHCNRGSGVDHYAAAARDEMRPSGLGGVENQVNFMMQGERPVFLREFTERAEARTAGVIVKNVDSAGFREAIRYPLFSFGRRAQIHGTVRHHLSSGTAHFGDGLLRRRLVDVASHDSRALCCKEFGGGAPHATRNAGDEGYLSSES